MDKAGSDCAVCLEFYGESKWPLSLFEFSTLFLIQVGDLKPVLIPIHMTVKGCPLYFQMTGPRAQDQNQGPIIQSVPQSFSPAIYTYICVFLMSGYLI